jgi:signal transduction histidine kinase
MGEYAEIRVEDNGMGMDATQIRRAFEPYFTSKKVNGTGLGLFITKKVIEDHRGAIELWSQPLAGTQVTIRLPLIDRAKATAA